MRNRLSRLSLVSLAGLTVLASACSSPAKGPTSAATTTTSPGKVTTNAGLCKLVVPSVVATALEGSVNYPITLTRGTTTECAYRGIHNSAEGVIIRYDTDINASDYAKNRAAFERRGLKLGPVEGLGDQAYYFAENARQSTVTTVVVLKGPLQLLVTGTAALDPIGSIARYALSQYLETHRAPTSSP